MKLKCKSCGKKIHLKLNNKGEVGLSGGMKILTHAFYCEEMKSKSNNADDEKILKLIESFFEVNVNE